MNRFYFTKMSGAGNDFILFDGKINPDLQLTPQIIRNICERRKGIGADGVLILSDIKEKAFKMEYFNADGSTGSLCGNGARCSILYGKESGRYDGEMIRFLANGNEYSGQVLNSNLVKFNLQPPLELKRNFKIKAGKQLINASYINTGSPHVVISIRDVLSDPGNPNSSYDNLDQIPVTELGREIRYHKDFTPSGTNVNFIDVRNDVIKIRTYERGVEDETLACGTGSTASAIIAAINGFVNPPVKLVVKSGAELIVDFKIEDQFVHNVSLIGPAEITFKGELII
jgi:diaminopimelate epimerase